MEFNVRRRAILNLCRMEVNLGMRTSELEGSKDMASEMTVRVSGKANESSTLQQL